MKNRKQHSELGSPEPIKTAGHGFYFYLSFISADMSYIQIYQKNNVSNKAQ